VTADDVIDMVVGQLLSTSTAYRAGWLAFAAEAGKIIDGLLAAESPEDQSPALSAFRAGQETALLAAAARIATAAAGAPVPL